MTPAIPGALTVVPPGERTSRRLRPPGAALHPAGTGGIGVELFDIAT